MIGLKFLLKNSPTFFAALLPFEEAMKLLDHITVGKGGWIKGSRNGQSWAVRTEEIAAIHTVPPEVMAGEQSAENPMNVPPWRGGGSGLRN